MLVILDKDGTLIKPASGGEFVQNPEDQVLLPGVPERVAELHELGATMVIASNQGGVAAGHKTLEEAIAEMHYCLSLLPLIDTGFFCPDLLGQECYLASSASNPGATFIHGLFKDLAGKFRKPNGGMLLAAFFLYKHSYPQRIYLQKAYMIGDRPEDQAAAEAAGVTFVDAEAWRTGTVRILGNGVVV